MQPVAGSHDYPFSCPNPECSAEYVIRTYQMAPGAVFAKLPDYVKPSIADRILTEPRCTECQTQFPWPVEVPPIAHT